MIRLSMAQVDDSELNQLRPVFEEYKHFGMGKFVDDFERAIKKQLDTAFEVVCVNTGTSALHASLEALQFPEGSEVLVPSLTFVASYQAISAAKLRPISCEVLDPSGHIDPSDLEKRITHETKAIMPVAYAGMDFDREAIYTLSNKYSLRVIEDDAHAFGGKTSNSQFFGATGDIVCFSFDGIKNITCGEGGAVLTSDPNLAHKIRVMRSLGIEKDVSLRYKGERAWEYDVASQGFRYHMSNINAAIGLAQIKKVEQNRLRKLEIYQRYLCEFEKFGIHRFLVVTQKFNPACNYHLFSCLLDDRYSREALRSFLKEKQIESGIHYAPNHLHSFYRSAYQLPITEKIGAQTISLPFHPSLSDHEVTQVIEALVEFFRIVQPRPLNQTDQN